MVSGEDTVTASDANTAADRENEVVDMRGAVFRSVVSHDDHGLLL